MAHNPKLEIFKIILKPTKENEDLTFRDFAQLYNESDSSDEETDASIFLDLFKRFIYEVDTSEFISNSKKFKAFTAYDTNPEGDNPPTVLPIPESNLIEGVIQGGRYGQKRTKSSITDKNSKEGVTISDIILDRFWFSLYLPFESDYGVLFIQSYSNDSISDIFTDFIRKFFSESGCFYKAKLERFVPNHIIEEFKQGGKLKRFSYSSRKLIRVQSNNPISEEPEEFTIKIEAVSKNGLSKEALPSWLRSLGGMKFDDTDLADFSKGKVYLQEEGSKKESPFSIDTDFDISPIIYLKDRIRIDEDGLPDLEELKEYTFNLLENHIKPEIYF